MKPRRSRRPLREELVRGSRPAAGSSQEALRRDRRARRGEITPGLSLAQIGRLARLSVLAATGREAALRRELRTSGLPTRAVREAFLQLILFAGYPRAINALFLLPPAAGERPTGGTVASRRRAGKRLCRRIYGRDFEPLIRNMRRLHPALAEGILEEGYGRVLSRQGLTPRERELVLVPVLAATCAWRQLPGHVQGAIRVGATRAELGAVAKAVGDLLGKRAKRAMQ